MHCWEAAKISQAAITECDETISHMVIAGRSYFRTLRNACVTAGKIYHGCSEMLS